MADQTGSIVTANGDTSNNQPLPSPANNAANLEAITEERDDLRRKLDDVQRELTALTGASSNADTINKLQQDNDHLRKTLKKATDMLREKITAINAQEKRNKALTQQITSLKEVLQVTRDLLNIRNMEVEQLQKNVDTMEERIEENRRRQSAMIKQMELATNINGQLRNEYETQLKLFQSLKGRYEEKVEKLTKLAKDRNAETEGAVEDTEKVETAEVASKTETVEVTEEASKTETAEVTEEASRTETAIITESGNAPLTEEAKESASEISVNIVTESTMENEQTEEAREPAEITS